MRAALPVLPVLLLTLAALAGCAKAPAPAAPAPVRAADTPVVGYLHDLSPMASADLASSGALLEHHRIPIGEAIELDSYVWRPATQGKVPVILTVTPYYGGGAPANSPLGTPSDTLADDFVPRGYAVGFVSVRGTGDSGGCFSQGGPQEAKDIARAVDYYGGLAWSNGNVGLIGVSYDGTTPQETWVEAPSHLKSIVPVSGISDLYKYNFVNGVPINVQGFGFNTYYWALVGAGPVGLSGGVGPSDPASFATAVAGEGCQEQANVQEGGVSSTADGNKDAYWQQRDFLARLKANPDKERAPVFYVHGLQDYNVKDHNMDGWIEAVQDTGVPFKAFLGQWQHAWPDNTLAAGNCKVSSTGAWPTCRADWWNATLVAWFDQTLKGIDTGIYDVPPVQVQDDNGTWRLESRWPPADARPWTLFPDASGGLRESAGSGRATYYDYQGDVVNQAASPPPQVPQVPRTMGPTQAVFVSAPVPADLHISGVPWFRGNVTATGQRASLVLTLAERRADGTEHSINFAGQSLNHVADLASGRQSIANLRQDVTVHFLPSEDVLHKGSSLVLYAAGNTIGSDRGGNVALQPVSDGSTITLDLAGAKLVLPIDESIVPEVPQPFEK
ncbi:MAG TPA: CocE/NonD family hydrolase [Candidatus Thermoplasmatota archaeon]|nr:CocE/NonD family hydrolase [Candidatus Thermoplasmatota archaeon]